MKTIFIILSIVIVSSLYSNAADVIVPAKGFTWGGDIGSTIDFSSSGKSSIDAEMNFGYKCPYFKVIGVGAGIHTCLSSNNTFIPVFALLRTSFSSKPKLCFLELKGGYSFNSLGNVSQSAPFGSIGLGCNLYRNSKFSSHIILSYNFYKINDFTTDDDKNVDAEDMHAVSIRIGINF